MAVMFTSDTFETEVLKSEIPVLVDFYADWCGPCKAMGPVVEELSKTYAGRVKVGKINVDENQDVAVRYGIMSIPTLLLIKGGDVIEKLVGMRDKKGLEAAIEKAL